MVIQVKIPFWRILILLWALPNIGSSFHGFQACKTSCISFKKAYVIKGWFWFSRKNWTIRFQKLDYPVFTGLTPPPPGQNLPLHRFSHFPLSHTQEQPWGWPQDPYWWSLGSSVESWNSWVKSTSQELVSPFPQSVFLLSLGIFT
jgi:hypothetical protein